MLCICDVAQERNDNNILTIDIAFLTCYTEHAVCNANTELWRSLFCPWQSY